MRENLWLRGFSPLNHFCNTKTTKAIPAGLSEKDLEKTALFLAADIDIHIANHYNVF